MATAAKLDAMPTAPFLPTVFRAKILPVTRSPSLPWAVVPSSSFAAGYYSGESYVGESYGTVASTIGLNDGNLCAGNTVLGINGRGHAVAMFAAVGDTRWSGGSYNRLKLAWTQGGTSGFGGFGCWLPAGTYRACGAIVVPNCYIADAGTLSTRIYGAERVYGQSSVWGGSGTFTLNGSQWVSVTSGSSSYSECGAVCIYRV